MTKIIGIVDGHSASVALVVDGSARFAIQDERPTRQKNRGGFPASALQQVMDASGLTWDAVDLFVFSTEHYLSQRLVSREDVMIMYGKAFAVLKEADVWVTGDRPPAAKLLAQQQERCAYLLGHGVGRDKIVFLEHHQCHAAIAYYAAGDLANDVLVLTCDGQGDRSSGSVSVGRRGTLSQLADISHVDSIGQLYTYITYLLGFVPLEHEYKLMGLAPYSEASRGASRIYDLLSEYFTWDAASPLVWRRRYAGLSGHKLAHVLEQDLRFCRFDEIAAGVQRFVEDFVVDWVRRAVRHTGIRRVVLGGGVFMNVKLNKKILELEEVDWLYVAPSCGDESNSIGAAFWGAAKLEEPDNAASGRGLGPLYLGHEASLSELSQAMDRVTSRPGIAAERMAQPEETCARLLAEGHIIARFTGRAEFGARALGNRSILARPDRWSVVSDINQAIKQRDFWMPFAPSILEEDARDLIVNPKNVYSPYMMLAFDTRPEWWERLAAVVHPYDKTCRPQIVRKDWNPSYHSLIARFKAMTGISAVLNTSFNLHGYPLVDTPEDAMDVFLNSGLTHLALEDWLVCKL